VELEPINLKGVMPEEQREKDDKGEENTDYF